VLEYPQSGERGRIDRQLRPRERRRTGPATLGRSDSQAAAIGQSVRIGISRDAHRLLRFWLRGSAFVSGPKSLNEPGIEARR